MFWFNAIIKSDLVVIKNQEELSHRLYIQSVYSSMAKVALGYY